MKNQQNGVALLTILLLVVSITIVAGSMLASQRVMVRHYELTQNQGQFYQYALAGESFAKQLLAEDSKNSRIDSLQELWAKPIPDYLVAGGSVKIQLKDESSLFNINNLYHNGQVDKVAFSYFQALLISVGIEPEIAFAVLDWQDPDSDTSADGGAEFDYYQSLGKKKLIRIANQPFISVDELLYVRGMDKQKLAKIKPFLTAIPFYLPMNVNTVKPELLTILPLVDSNANQTHNSSTNSSATAETVVPKSEMDLLNPIAVNDWAMQREQNLPLNQVEELWQIPVFATLKTEQQQTVSPLFDVQSRAFRFLGIVKVDEKQRFFTSQLAKIDQDSTNNQSLFMLNQQNSLSKNIVSFHQQLLPYAPEF